MFGLCTSAMITCRRSRQCASDQRAQSKSWCSTTRCSQLLHGFVLHSSINMNSGVLPGSMVRELLTSCAQVQTARMLTPDGASSYTVLVHCSSCAAFIRMLRQDSQLPFVVIAGVSSVKGTRDRTPCQRAAHNVHRGPTWR
jgi:hypothetical protein